MPYLQLDLPDRHPPDTKRKLAQRLAAIFARVMQIPNDRVRVGFHEMPDGSLWLCGEDGTRPCAVLSCDFRRGRSRAQREELAAALAQACTESLGLRCDLLVSFTQHPGEDFFRPGLGLAEEWTPGEAVALPQS